MSLKTQTFLTDLYKLQTSYEVVLCHVMSCQWEINPPTTFADWSLCEDHPFHLSWISDQKQSDDDKAAEESLTSHDRAMNTKLLTQQ